MVSGRGGFELARKAVAAGLQLWLRLYPFKLGG